MRRTRKGSTQHLLHTGNWRHFRESAKENKKTHCEYLKPLYTLKQEDIFWPGLTPFEVNGKTTGFQEKVFS